MIRTSLLLYITHHAYSYTYIYTINTVFNTTTLLISTWSTSGTLVIEGDGFRGRFWGCLKNGGVFSFVRFIDPWNMKQPKTSIFLIHALIRAWRWQSINFEQWLTPGLNIIFLIFVWKSHILTVLRHYNYKRLKKKMWKYLRIHKEMILTNK